MQVGGSSRGPRSDINVTPLVDVVLVLLIIFMVLTPIVQMGYQVKVPPKAPPGTPMDLMRDQIVLRYLPGQQAMINEERVPLSEFPRRLHEVMKGRSGKMVFFAGSPGVEYEETMRFLDTARAAGAYNIGIIVDELPP
jgi:biopolymer transport protein ExbD